MATTSFTWEVPGQQYSCQTLHLTWNYVGVATPFNISLTNVNVVQASPPSSQISSGITATTVTSATTPSNIFTSAFPSITLRAVPRQDAGGTFQTLIGENVAATARSYDVSQLPAPQGWYQLIAGSDPGAFSQRSSSFFVWNSADTSCIAPPASSSTVPAGSSAGASSTASPGSTGIPSNEPSGGSKNNAGPIAGGVIGGLVFLGLIVFAFFWLGRRQKQKRAAAVQAVGGAPATGHRKGPKWGGLSSVDSIDAGALAAVTANSPPDSRQKNFGALAMSDRRVSRSASTGPYAHEDEEKGSPSPTSPFTEESDFTFTPDALGYQYSATSSNRRPSATTRHSGISELSGGVPLDPSGALSASDHSTNHDNARQPTQPSHSPTPGDGAKPRRKPVPSYTPSTVSGLGFAPNPNADNPPAMPNVPMQPGGSPSPSASGHYAVGQGRAPPEHERQWGKDGQVHYLIPDMPPPGRI